MLLFYSWLLSHEEDKESSFDSGKSWMKAPPEAPAGMDASDEVMRNLVSMLFCVYFAKLFSEFHLINLD